MDIQVEVQFTIQHTLEELKDEFVRKGHIPSWHIMDADTRPQLFFETRSIAFNLSTEEDRFLWFVFSMEACGELKTCIAIRNVVPSGVNVDFPNLKDFLYFCRNSLVGSPGQA